MSAPGPAARLLPLDRRAGLPGWCDPFLAPAWTGEFFASRAWYDTLIAHALPAEVEPVLALCGPGDAALLPLLRSRHGGRLTALVSPYTLDWRPLPAPGAEPGALREAARGFGRLLRFRPPILLDTLDPEAPGVGAFLGGLAASGRLVVERYRHTGNWHEELPAETGWAAYLAARPPALRTTVTRKLARSAREMEFELVSEGPSPALEAAIAAYEDVRARSWKPHEPYPHFDGALMRVAAALGVLRLGVLRARADGRPVAAQYWILDRGGRRAQVPKLAYAEESRAASPGTVLTALMIRRLLEEDGVREFDFGRGDDSYKQLWVSQRRQRIGVVVADPLHPAGLLQVARRVAGQARRQALAWLGRSSPLPAQPEG